MINVCWITEAYWVTKLLVLDLVINVEVENNTLFHMF